VFDFNKLRRVVMIMKKGHERETELSDFVNGDFDSVLGSQYQVGFCYRRGITFVQSQFETSQQDSDEGLLLHQCEVLTNAAIE